MDKIFVIDVNVIISVLMSGNIKIKKFLKENKVYAPDYLLFELKMYEKRVLEKNKMEMRILRELIKEIFEELIIIPSMYISKGIKREAEKLVKDIDEKDAPYVALTLAMEGSELITRDKKLIESLRGKIKIKNLKDVIG